LNTILARKTVTNQLVSPPPRRTPKRGFAGQKVGVSLGGESS